MEQRPNILMITVDQQRYDCIGFSKAYPVKTPNLDQFASEGIWFSNAYAHLPACGPARQSFMNGRRPEAIGCLWNFNNGLKIPALEPSEYAWSRELIKLNYQTAYIGKWGVHPVNAPTQYGYEHYVDEREYELFQKERYPNVRFVNTYFGESNPIPVEDSKTHWTAKKATDMIEKLSKSGKPWHIRVNFSEPHLPCRPSKPFSEMYSLDDIPMWNNFYDSFENKPYIQKQQLYSWGVENYTWDNWAPIVARYYGIISQLDDAIGKILSTLDQLAASENTIVIYTSDHGDLCGAHRMMDKHYVLYEEVIKVPLIIKWKKGIPKNRICDEFVYNFLDLPPTILEWLKVDIPNFFQGRSLVKLLHGKRVKDWRNHLVSTYNGQQFGLYTQRMIRNHHWKYIWNTTDIDELYDLKEDPSELNNRIYDQSNSNIVKQLRETLYWQLHHDQDGLVDNQWMKLQLLGGRKL
ncbi:sulfatase-like hydrolase/transferase [Neobacillus cucumis]|uniref:sulfatase-like hydrolase/transferase n=1 Tax=Neobacillus cucumis TaxID=1740721 RepID=UPI00203AA600|nr:sulfatase-like hydrolase/transferase [Neobacillus cucumis]MCM3724763.1 sulfatase-like hydrolase/transferase [Neobacillus cucumis]